jgi:diguanylate cyclase (GGDEF)-like protein
MNSLLLLFNVLDPGSILTAGGLVALAGAAPLALQTYRAKADQLALLVATVALLLSSAAFFSYVIEAAPSFTHHSLLSGLLTTAAYFCGAVCTGLLFSKALPKRLLYTIAFIFVAGYCVWHEGSAQSQWKNVSQLISAVVCIKIILSDGGTLGRKPKIVGITLAFFVAIGAVIRFAAYGASTYELVTFKIAALLWAITPVLAYACVVYIVQKRLNLTLRNAIDFDALTGAHSRRYLFDQGKALVENKRGHENTSTVVLLIDLDHFKEVNDQWGHTVGDCVLRHAVQCIKAAMRDTDTIVARYGGEEFCVILKNTDSERSLEVAERIRKKIAETPYHFEDKEISITASIGQAKVDVHGGESLSSLIRLADQRLYAAKHGGRNQVIAA